MSKASEARDRRYFKAIKTIAEHTVRIALDDAKAVARDDIATYKAGGEEPPMSYDEYVEDQFIDNFENYKGDLIAVDLEDAYNDALEAEGLST